MQSVLKRCRKLKWMQHNPFENVTDRLSKPKHRERRATDEEIELLSVALKAQDLDDIRLKKSETEVAFLLEIESGMRLSEMTRANKADVDLDNGYFNLPDSKNNDSRMVPLTVGRWSWLGRYRRGRILNMKNCST